MVTLQLNQNQAEVLLGLIDIATKASGLNVAEAAVFFSKTIEQQLNTQSEENIESDSEKES